MVGKKVVQMALTRAVKWAAELDTAMAAKRVGKKDVGKVK